MHQTETLHAVKDPISLSGIEKISFTEEIMFTAEMLRNSPTRTMEQSVNNYLKTPEEMEAEFCFVINSRRAAYYETNDSYDTYGRLIKKTDGYMNIHNLDEALSGFMEENY